MSGGCLPMLGKPRSGPPRENAGVKKHRPSLSAPGATRARGFTLIEVMVALIVLVLGVLGAAAMTLSAVRDTKQSGLRSQASAFAYELSDLMRANGATSGSPQETIFLSHGGASVPGCWAGAGCSVAQMAANDLYEWQTKLTGANGLPNGAWVVCHDSSANVASLACNNDPAASLVIKLQYDEKSNVARDAVARGTVAPSVRRVVVLPISSDY